VAWQNGLTPIAGLIVWLIRWPPLRFHCSTTIEMRAGSNSPVRQTPETDKTESHQAFRRFDRDVEDRTIGDSIDFKVMLWVASQMI
jgi:hypothetical protein